MIADPAEPGSLDVDVPAGPEGSSDLSGDLANSVEPAEQDEPTSPADLDELANPTGTDGPTSPADLGEPDLPLPAELPAEAGEPEPATQADADLGPSSDALNGQELAGQELTEQEPIDALAESDSDGAPSQLDGSESEDSNEALAAVDVPEGADADDAAVTEEPITATEAANAELGSGVIASGTWGTCDWEIDDEGKLTVHAGVGSEDGSGKWPSGSADPALDTTGIKAVVFESGVVLPANCESLLFGLHSLESASLVGADWSHVTTTKLMFSHCTSLSDLQLGDPDTSNVTDMSCMFWACASLTRIPGLEGFETAKVTDMSRMFDSCTRLAFLDLSSFDLSSLQAFPMFARNCPSIMIMTLGTGFTPNATAAQAMVPGLFIECDTFMVSDSSSWYTLGEIVSSRLGIPATYWTAAWSTGAGQEGERMLTPSCVSLPTRDYEYTGSAVAPIPVVTYGSDTLTLGTDFTLGYDSNVAPRFVFMNIKGKGGYSGVVTTVFRIVPSDVASAQVSAVPDQLYTGSALTPVITVSKDGRTLEAGTDYDISYTNNTQVGTATMTITGKGNYTGTKAVTFRIVETYLTNATVTLPKTTYDYTGSAIKPVPTVKLDDKTLKEGTDYTVSYKNNVESGTATVTVMGAGAYGGEKSATFTIKAAPSLSGAAVTVSPTSLVYDGTARKPKVTVKVGGKTLKEGTDYTLSWTGGPTFGQLTAKVTGKGGYTGSKTATARINFTDTPTDAWYQTQGWLDYVVNDGVMTGLKDARGFTGAFAPEATVTRAQVAVVLFRFANPDSEATSNPAHYGKVTRFHDVPAGQWHTAAIEWCAEKGIVTGYGTTGNFGPDDPVTREQLATMMYRFATGQGASTSAPASALSKAPDASAISDWARDAMAWCAANKVITGYAQDGRVDPQGSATRAQLAKIITVVTRDVLE